MNSTQEPNHHVIAEAVVKITQNARKGVRLEETVLLAWFCNKSMNLICFWKLRKS